ncbi:MAG: hypothetical protein KDD47_23750, partial [Acidobacteria bacterium]|nr:hypothetical protein [Acidobacteriota bacterium]
MTENPRPACKVPETKTTSRRPAVTLLLASALLCFPAGAQLVVETRALRPDGRPLPGAVMEALPVPSNLEMQGALLDGRLPPATFRTVADSEGFLRLHLPEDGIWRVQVRAAGFISLWIPTLPAAEDLVLPPARLGRARDTRITFVVDEKPAPPGTAVFAEGGDRGFWKDYEVGPWRLAPRIGWVGAEGTVLLPRGPGEALDLWVLQPTVCQPQRAEAHCDGRITLDPSPKARATWVFRDEEGRPIAGAILTTRRRPLPLGRSGPDGRLELRCRPETELEALAFAPGQRLEALSGRAGSGRELTFRAPVLIRGKVTVASGQEAAGVLVWPSGEPADARRTDTQGEFELHLPRGWPHRTEALRKGMRGALQTFSGPSIPDLASLVLAPAVELVGTVQDAAGQPLAG